MIKFSVSVLIALVLLAIANQLFSATADARIKLKVMWPDGTPAAGVKWVADGTGPVGLLSGLATGVTDKDGHAHLYLGTGHWTLTVNCNTLEFDVQPGLPPEEPSLIEVTLCITNYLPVIGR